MPAPTPSCRAVRSGTRSATSAAARAGFALLLGLTCSGGELEVWASEVEPLAGATETVPARPSLLLVTIDTLRADHCSAYGYPRPTTPHLDSAAREGALFETAYAVTPTTLPSHATLFTSRYPSELGVRKNGEKLPAEAVTLAELLRNEGYRTAAFVSSFAVSGLFQIDQGFDVYDDDFSESESTMRDEHWEGLRVAHFDRRAADTTDAAIAWLQSARHERPFFLWVHYFDPHQPLAAPEPYGSLFETPDPKAPRQRFLDAYDAEVRYADEQLGRLLEAVEEVAPGPRTLTVLTSDHGEGLWDHGWLQHGIFLYEEATRVPLVLRWPGRIRPGQRIAAHVGLIDVVPTLLGLLDLEADGIEPRGVDLTEVLTGTAEADLDRRIFLQRRRYRKGKQDFRRVSGESRAVRWRHWKLIESPREVGIELFDLARDPGERDNVVGLNPDIRRGLLGDLEAWRASLRARPGSAEELPEETREGLEALGYAE